ncbi:MULTISPECIES: GGDEF domain-containing response regulator [Kordiimonas]|uniref:GGDEF domain-containing response regulator n=1 Tax=Kordiimonas TaxID=288021 RepID=UPI00257DA9E7|nr:diguanylate cyclase [Kordiimonas sp. UBA4487]
MDHKILIIDDLEIMRTMLSGIAKEFGEVVTAATGKDGLIAALEHKPTLILLDVVLPDIDGFKVCEALKKDYRTQDIPVVLVTGMEKDEDAESKGLTMGAADYILKPIKVPVVRARIQTQLTLAEKSKALEEANKELTHLAMTDALTGCFNRRYFMNAADMELSRMKRHGYPVVVAMIDVDHFKRINDQYGHEVGDEVLSVVAKCCDETVRYEDTLGRLGGEEFAVLLPVADAEGAYGVLERLRQTVSDLTFPNVPDLRVTVSIGIAELTGEDMSIDAGIKRADEAMYKAKKAGRNKVEIA